MSDADGMDRVRWYRSRGDAAVWGSFGAFFLAVFGLAVPERAAEAMVFCGTVGAFFVYTAVGYLRGGVGVSQSGIAVRSVAGRTVHVPWSHVAGFSIATKRGKNGRYYQLQVQRTEGRPLSTWACAWRQQSRLRELVATLDEARSQYASAGASQAG
jgi:hypothetical protein